MSKPASLSVDAVWAQLPQTQCTRCGYADCRAYAQAIVDEGVGIDQCPPGGAQGVARLAALTGRPNSGLNPAFGAEGPLRLAVIDENWCIGCTLCIQACPVDAIVGANKRMHTVDAQACTGCELCVPACPVDCVDMQAAQPGQGDAPAATGWDAWSAEQAQQARARYAWHQIRLHRDADEQQARLQAKAQHKLAHLPELTHWKDAGELDAKRAAIEAALARARARRSAGQD